jgi:hypothetical protein
MIFSIRQLILAEEGGEPLTESELLIKIRFEYACDGERRDRRLSLLCVLFFIGLAAAFFLTLGLGVAKLKIAS